MLIFIHFPFSFVAKASIDNKQELVQVRNQCHTDIKQAITWTHDDPVTDLSRHHQVSMF